LFGRRSVSRRRQDCPSGHQCLLSAPGLPRRPAHHHSRRNRVQRTPTPYSRTYGGPARVSMWFLYSGSVYHSGQPRLIPRPGIVVSMYAMIRNAAYEKRRLTAEDVELQVGCSTCQFVSYMNFRRASSMAICADVPLTDPFWTLQGPLSPSTTAMRSKTSKPTWSILRYLAAAKVSRLQRDAVAKTAARQVAARRMMPEPPSSSRSILSLSSRIGRGRS
jgi:hypothetical protein